MAAVGVSFSPSRGRYAKDMYTESASLYIQALLRKLFVYITNSTHAGGVIVGDERGMREGGRGGGGSSEVRSESLFSLLASISTGKYFNPITHLLLQGTSPN